MIIKQLKLGADAVFCYVLACEKTREAIIIDPSGDENDLLALLKEMRLKLKFIINTHCHPDHTCGNKFIKEATQASIIRHEADEHFLQDQTAKEYFSRQGYTPSPPADRIVKDNDQLVFGNHILRIIHTPGHSPGSICLYVDGNLFTGDSLFVGAAGRVDLPGGDFTTLLKSLDSKIAVLPDDTIIWPGHDYGDSITSTIGREKKENPYLGGEW
jgi:glyoxylase-like metal-dependent hydrolase (beta-lactamase superfamily II)